MGVVSREDFEMKFAELDKMMREGETENDYIFPEDVFICVRLDGHGFTSLTKNMSFNKPFDEDFRDLMIATTKHLMDVGFKIIYGYTMSDEISLLFDLDDNTFNRKERKIISILAGEASAKFSVLLEKTVCFDCRARGFLHKNEIIDYFSWRVADSERNSLNSYCYWTLRKNGDSARQATKKLEKVSVLDKKKLLLNEGVDFKEVPKWQKSGIGFSYEEYIKDGENPITGEITKATRRRIKTHMNIPMMLGNNNLLDRIVEVNLMEREHV